MLKLIRKKHQKHLLGVFHLCCSENKEMRKDEGFSPLQSKPWHPLHLQPTSLLSRDVSLPQHTEKKSSQDKPVPSMPCLQRKEIPQARCHHLKGTVVSLSPILLSVPFPALTCKLQSWKRDSLIQKMSDKNSRVQGIGDQVATDHSSLSR